MEGAAKKIKSSSKTLFDLPPCLLEWLILKFFTWNTIGNLLLSDKMNDFCDRRGIFEKLKWENDHQALGCHIFHENLKKDNINAIKAWYHELEYLPQTRDTVNILIRSNPPKCTNFLFNIGIEPGPRRSWKMWGREVIEHNAYHVLEMLLKKDTYDPAAYSNEPVYYAVLKERPDIVRVLMTDPRVDPSSCDNRAFRVAVEKCNAEMCHLLLRDERVRQQARVNADYLIKRSIFQDKLDFIRCMLVEKLIEPAAVQTLISSLTALFE